MNLLGVVIPIYNTQKFLRKCIDSVLSQTYNNIRVVLVDDGSTDESGMICDEYANYDTRVHVIHQNNKGMLYARYIGVKMLKDCQYITFVDSDDWISQDTYLKLSQYMEQDVDVISYGIIRYFNEQYKYRSLDNFENRIYYGYEIREEIWPGMLWNIKKKEFGIDPSVCNKIIKYDLIMNELSKLKEYKIAYGQDVALTYPLLKKVDSLYFYNECLYYHRQRQNGEIAEYLTEGGFYEKLLQLYNYLMSQFGNDKSMEEQIDFFFSDSTRHHLKKYAYVNDNMDIVPFDLMTPHKRIVLYGASQLGQKYYYQINKINYGEIVAWVDKHKTKIDNIVLQNIDYFIGDNIYDYVLIAVKNKEVAQEIRHELIKKGVSDEIIIWRV